MSRNFNNNNYNNDHKRRSPPAKNYDPTGKRAYEEDQDRENTSDFIEGRNAVLEAIRAEITIDKVFIAKGDVDAALRHIASTARQTGAVVVEVDRRKLDAMSHTHAHQGVIAVASSTSYISVDEILKKAETKNESPLVVICESISDPHNLGAIIRTCEAAGAHGVIIPKRRSSGLGAIVAKSSGGAVYHTPVARVSNISMTIKELKKAGLWIFGTDSKGTTELWQADFNIPLAIVIGSEGAGISRLVSESCDFLINIPMFGKISSLNASVSAGILLYEVVRQRNN